MGDDTITLELTIKKSDLGMFGQPQQAIPCSGASQESDPITAIIELISAPRGTYDHEAGESYVLCPRLKEIYDNSSRLMCYEGEPVEKWDIHNKDLLKNMRPCPYYHPAKKNR